MLLHSPPFTPNNRANGIEINVKGQYGVQVRIFDDCFNGRQNPSSQLYVSG